VFAVRVEEQQCVELLCNMKVLCTFLYKFRLFTKTSNSTKTQTNCRMLHCVCFLFRRAIGRRWVDMHCWLVRCFLFSRAIGRRWIDMLCWLVRCFLFSRAIGRRWIDMLCWLVRSNIDGRAPLPSGQWVCSTVSSFSVISTNLCGYISALRHWRFQTLAVV